MDIIIDNNDCKIIISQIIDNLNNLASFLGADTETLVNYAQRNFRSLRRQNEWLTTRAMLYYSMGKGAEITYAPSGRPALIGSDLNISISHTKNCAALMISPHEAIGIDIEQYAPKILRLKERIAHADELPTNYDSLDEASRIKWLTQLWTIKEAVYKSTADQSDLDMLQDIRAILNGWPLLDSATAYTINNHSAMQHDATPSQHSVSGRAHSLCIGDCCCTYTIRKQAKGMTI